MRLLLLALGVSSFILGDCAAAATPAAKPPAPAPPSGGGTGVAVVVLHGIGDWRNRSIPFLPFGEPRSLAQAVRDALPQAYVLNAVYGNSGDAGDQRAGAFGRFGDVVADTCAQLVADAQLIAAARIHLMGISEGALMLRGMLQHPSCGRLRIASLISLAGPHAGVSALPFCQPLTGEDSGAPCRQITELLRGDAYSPELQNSFLPAAYYVDPTLSLSQFADHGTWLARANGLAGTPPWQSAYAKHRLTSLERLVLYRFEEDTLMAPRDTAWFGYLDGCPARVLQLWEQPGWEADVLGLRALNESGRLLLLTAPGQHATFTTPWFVEHIIRPFL